MCAEKSKENPPGYYADRTRILPYSRIIRSRNKRTDRHERENLRQPGPVLAGTTRPANIAVDAVAWAWAWIGSPSRASHSSTQSCSVDGDLQSHHLNCSGGSRRLATHWRFPSISARAPRRRLPRPQQRRRSQDHARGRGYGKVENLRRRFRGWRLWRQPSGRPAPRYMGSSGRGKLMRKYVVD